MSQLAAPRTSFLDMACECGRTRRQHMRGAGEDHSFEPVEWPRRVFGPLPIEPRDPEPSALTTFTTMASTLVPAPKPYVVELEIECTVTSDAVVEQVREGQAALVELGEELVAKASRPKRYACGKCGVVGHTARSCGRPSTYRPGADRDIKPWISSPDKVEPVEVEPAYTAPEQPEPVEPDDDQDEAEAFDRRAAPSPRSAPAPVSHNNRFALIEAAARARSGGR